MKGMSTLKAFVVAGVVALAASAAQAGTVALTVNGGWTEFTFPDANPNDGSGGVWDDDFTFTLVGTGTLKVTDAYLSGDKFSVTINDGTTSTTYLTSEPTAVGASIGSDFDGAFADARWSSRSWTLGPGSYTISGREVYGVFDGGSGGIRVDSRVRAVPLPAAAWMGLSGIGALVALARRRRR